MSSIGHLVGYMIGTIDMVSLFGTFLGDTQFKKMTVISAFGLLFPIGVTCYTVHERTLVALKSVCLCPQAHGVNADVAFPEIPMQKTAISRSSSIFSRLLLVFHRGSKLSAGFSSGCG